MKPPPKRLSESAVADNIRPATRDLPSKLAGLPFDRYKRAESKSVPASEPGRSTVSASHVVKNFDDKAKAPQRVPSGMSQFFLLH